MKVSDESQRELHRGEGGHVGKGPGRPGLWILMGLLCAPRGPMVSCQLDEGRDPDRAPDNGLNPQTPATGAPQDRQNTKGPITPSVTTECTSDVAATPRPEGQNRAGLEIVSGDSVVLVRILIADPKAAVYERATLPIVDLGLFTAEVTDAQGRSCYANFEINSLDQDVKVTVSMESVTE